MANLIRDGLSKIRTIIYNHSSVTTADIIYLLAGIPMLAQNSELANVDNVFTIAGLIEYAKKTTQVWTGGQKLYWDDTNSEFTTVTTGNTLAGVADRPAASADTTGFIILMPALSAGVTKEVISVALPPLTVNTTTRRGVIAAGRSMQITRVSIGSYTKPNDADGVMTLALEKYDKSGTAEKNLLGAATFDLESLTAKEAEDLTLTSTTADLVVDAGDLVYVEMVNDSAAIDTNLEGALTIEVDLL